MAETRQDRKQRWETRVAAAKKLREQWETTYRVKELERLYTLGQETETPGEDRLFANHFFATVQAQKPALLPRSTSFLVKPRGGRKPFGSLEANIQQAVLQTIATQDDNLWNDVSLALTQAFFRVGVLKVAYDPRFEPNPQFGEMPTAEAGVFLEGEGGAPASGPPAEPRTLLTDEVYRFEWVDARKLLLPDEGPNVRTWSWIGEEIEVPLEDAKEDPRFPASKRRQLKANGTADPQARDRTTPPDGSDPAADEWARFRYYECWDIANKKLYVWADGQDFDDFLLEEDFPTGIDDHPFALVRFLPITGPEPSPWPVPLTYNWLPLQQDYNLLRQQQSNAARRAARKFLYELATFPDEEELDKFTSAADMQGVAVNDLARPPLMFGEASLNVDVSKAMALSSNDWRVVTGASGTRLGDPDADTATEAVLVEQSSALRDTDLRLLVDKWVAQAGRKMLQLVKQTLTLDLWVELRGFSDKEFQEFLQKPAFATMLALQLGPENVPAFLAALELSPGLQERFKQRFGQVKPMQVTRAQLQWEADVEVLPSAARPLQQTQLLRLASVLGPLAFGSPTFVEELLMSFDLPQGERIAEEITLSLRQMQQAQQQMQAMPQGDNGAAKRSLRTGPLGAVGGRVGV